MESRGGRLEGCGKNLSPVIPRPLCGRGISLCPGLSGLQGGIPRCARNDKRGYGITTMAALYQGTALAVPLRRGKIFFGAGSSARLKPGPDTMPAKNAARLGAGFFVARGSSEWRLKADSHGALRRASGWCAGAPRAAIAGSKPGAPAAHRAELQQRRYSEAATEEAVRETRAGHASPGFVATNAVCPASRAAMGGLGRQPNRFTRRRIHA
jgi:hypothetical protein